MADNGFKQLNLPEAENVSVVSSQTLQNVIPSRKIYEIPVNIVPINYY